MKIDMKEYKKEFRKMWIALSKHPEWNKIDYLRSVDKVGITNQCFSCQFIADMLGIDEDMDGFNSNICEKCPIDWVVDKENSNYVDKAYPCTNSVYFEWVYQKNMKKRAKYAKIISELSWTNKFEEE